MPDAPPAIAFACFAEAVDDAEHALAVLFQRGMAVSRHRAILIQRRDDFDASLEAHADANTKVRPIEGATQFVGGEFLQFLDIRLNVFDAGDPDDVVDNLMFCI
jgi:triphosphoribosyl-dephospho-CoA synthetase